MLDASKAGVARQDIDGEDLFALIGVAGWIDDPPAFEDRADRLSSVISSALLSRPRDHANAEPA